MNPNLNLSFDPYEVLQIDRSATLKDIQSAYRFLAKQYHPDKGGNPAMWNILQQSYQSVTQQTRNQNHPIHPNQPNHPNHPNPQNGRGQHITPEQALQQREQLTNGMRGNLNPDSFQGSVFNAQFASLSQNNQDFVYGVDDSVYQPRNLADYRRERDSISQDLDRIQPIFNNGRGFDPNTFNRLFEKLKNKREDQTRDLVPYEEPRAMVSQNQVQFSNLNPHATSNSKYDISTRDLQENYCDLEDNNHHAQSFQNPYKVSKRELQRHLGQPDITQITALKQSDLKQRLAERNNANVNIPRGGAPPSGDLNYVFDGFDRHQQAALDRINQQAQTGRIAYNPNELTPQHPLPPSNQPTQLSLPAPNKPETTYRSRSNNSGELPHPAQNINYTPQNPALIEPPQNSHQISQEQVFHPNPNHHSSHPSRSHHQSQRSHHRSSRTREFRYPEGISEAKENHRFSDLEEMQEKMRKMEKTIKVQDKLIRRINHSIRK